MSEADNEEPKCRHLHSFVCHHLPTSGAQPGLKVGVIREKQDMLEFMYYLYWTDMGLSESWSGFSNAGFPLSTLFGVHMSQDDLQTFRRGRPPKQSFLNWQAEADRTGSNNEVWYEWYVWLWKVLPEERICPTCAHGLTSWFQSLREDASMGKCLQTLFSD